MGEEKRKRFSCFFPLLQINPVYCSPLKKNYSTRSNIDFPRSDLSIALHACLDARRAAPSALPSQSQSLSLSLSLCCIGSIYGDAVSGLSGGVLSLANQDRSTARGEPGQRAVQIGAAKDGTAADMVEGSFLPLRAQETADHAL